MTNQASELYELCKEVYELTGWEVGLNVIRDDGAVFDELSDHCLINGKEFVPLYTSDYLLEKLPPVIFIRTSDGANLTAILTLWINGDKTAHVAYMIPFDEQNRGEYARESDTPLKALLKLTIALSEEGELK